jgi:hypothetical protein
MTKILSAFITFKNDDAYHFALECFKMKITNILDQNQVLLGKKIDIKKA